MSPQPSVPTIDVPQQVEDLLERAVTQCASDLHLEPVAQGYEARLRVDGLLGTCARFSAEDGRMLVTRLMVLAQLLTYRPDVPQEGRVSVMLATLGRSVDLRLAVMPTIHGPRAVVRLPAELTQPRTLADLGLPEQALAGLRAFASADAGLLLLTGPAGSGKTTTIYALVEYIAAAHPGLSIVSLEDPVERALRGVTQVEVAPFGQLTYERVLRSMLRQDPQVLVLGEIRDGHTAAIAVQAALTGHRLISTLHAGSPGGALVRLLEMGIEPYQAASSLFGVAALRLVRRSDGQGGYRGRTPLAQWVRLDDELRQAVLGRAGAQAIDQRLAARPGHVTLRQSAQQLIQQGVTDQAEVQRVLGDQEA